MRRRTGAPCLTAIIIVAGTSWLQACTGHVPGAQGGTAKQAAHLPAGKSDTPKRVASSSERDCLVRAMYFESNRSSKDGLMAVGTVVMNRVASPLHPASICGVVGEPRQFAPGVLTRAMNQKELPPVERAADAVLRGERYAPIGDAMHFHVAGLQIPYRVQYVAETGGNAFYLRADRRLKQARTARKKETTEVAAAGTDEAKATTLAEATPKPSLIETVAGTRTAKPCEPASSAFGAASLACESEGAGR